MRVFDYLADERNATCDQSLGYNVVCSLGGMETVLGDIT
jgi:hypothetical protein